MNELILTKTSTENEIKAYFQKVLDLKQSGEEFPVDLELVWPLVYGRKEEATRSLRDEFIESVDYQVLRKNAENPLGGRPSEIYLLTVSCLEYFIVRKVRPVFEVYRKVFHRTAEQKPLSALEALKITVQALEEQEKRLNEVEYKVNTIIEKQIEAENELKALPLSTETVPEMSLRDKCRLLVNRYCSATGTYQQAVWDNVYQTLYYNFHIAIKSYQKLNKNESWLDVADRKGCIDKIYIVVSNLLKEKGIAA